MILNAQIKFLQEKAERNVEMIPFQDCKKIN